MSPELAYVTARYPALAPLARLRTEARLTAIGAASRSSRLRARSAARSGLRQTASRSPGELQRAAVQQIPDGRRAQPGEVMTRGF